MSNVTVVIPTYRGLQWLPSCLAALRAQTYRDFDITVVDDASTDGSAEYLRQQPDIRVIRTEKNVGFAVGCNMAIRASTAPFIALLNDDTEADPRWLERLMEPMLHAAQSRPAPEKIGMCASLMLRADNPNIVDNAGTAMDHAAIEFSRFFGDTAEAANQPCEIFSPSGGACLYRRAMLDEVGLFDERFFAYCEDTDLGWRARRVGWHCWYMPDSRVLHKGSASFGESSPFKMRLLTRNRLWMVLRSGRWRDMPIVAAFEIPAIVSQLVKWRDASRLKWTWEAIRGAGPILRDRWQRRHTKHDDANVLLAMDPLVPPWQVMKRYRPPAEQPLVAGR